MKKLKKYMILKNQETFFDQIFQPLKLPFQPKKEDFTKFLITLLEKIKDFKFVALTEF